MRLTLDPQAVDVATKRWRRRRRGGEGEEGEEEVLLTAYNE